MSARDDVDGLGTGTQPIACDGALPRRLLALDLLVLAFGGCVGVELELHFHHIFQALDRAAGFALGFLFPRAFDQILENRCFIV